MSKSLREELNSIKRKVKCIECKPDSGGGIQSVQPGTNITVDNTDPLNPVVNSTGGTVDEVSATQKGIVNNTSLQELGGVDKLINNVRVGKGNSNRDNTVLGVSTLNVNTTGENNVAIGSAVLNSNTTGSFNTGVGGYALWKNTTGNWNAAFGETLVYNTTGTRNVGVGASLYHNKTGSHNTGIGFNAGYAIESGNYNTYLGRSAGYDNGVGSYNVGVGAFAMIIVGGGYSSGGSTVNMNNNVFVGANLRGNSTMSDTLAIDNKGATITDAANALIYGGFTVANRFLNIGGKLSVTPSYMPNATAAETKKVVWNPITGVFAVKDDTSGSTSINSNKQRFTGNTVSAKTLLYTPITNSVSVILNGLELDEQGGDYTVSGTTVTLSNEPLTTDVIVIKYLY